MAERLQITQATYAKMEKAKRPHRKTLKRIAEVLNISSYQLHLG